MSRFAGLNADLNAFTGITRSMLGLALALATSDGAHAQATWSLYNGYGTSFTIPFANNATFSPGGSLNVEVTVGGKRARLEVDTGSEAVVIPAAVLGYTPSGPQSTIRYSSSGNSSTGVWVQLPIKFLGSNDGNGNVATATVPVFVETSTTSGKTGVVTDCTAASTGCSFMMGVGYGGKTDGWTGQTLNLSTNALVNIQAPVGQTMRPGYIITAAGIQVGLTAQNAGQGFAYIQLQPPTNGSASPWGTPVGSATIVNSGTATVSGSTISNIQPILVDTGINYLWGHLGDATTPCPTNSSFNCAPTGTSVTVYLGPGSYVGYAYTVDGSGNPSAAPEYSRDSAGMPAINTGINPLSQFDILFDPVGGFAGYRLTGTATSGVYFTPYLSTAGALPLPDGFSTNLPVYVSDATTISTGGSIGFSGNVTGPASLTFAGPGSVTFGGTIKLPSVIVTSGSATFLANVTAPQVQIAGGAAATNNATLTGTVTNAGQFTNKGTVNGSVTNSGTLTNDGTVNGVVTSTGTMNGNGVITGALAIHGRVAPGHSVGVVAVNGNVELRRGSVYEAELGPAGTSDRILASGSVTLDGTRIVVSPYAGYTPGLDSYQIITAGGGVSGTYSVSAPDFGTLPAAYPFLAANGRITGSGLTIDMVRSAVPFAAAGITANETATGRGLDTLGQQGTLFNALLGLNAATAAGAYDQLSGEIYASTQSVLIDQSFYVRDGVLGRLRQESGAPGAAGAVQTATLVPGLPLTLWGEGYGGWGQAGGNGNSAGDSRSIGGFLMGLDLPLGTNWRAGLAGGYSQSSFSADARGSSGTSDNYDVALYAGGALAAVGPGTLNLRTGAAYAWHDIAMSRSAAFSGFANALTAGYGADTAQVFAELGYGFTLEKTPLGRVGLEPFAGLAYVHLSTDGLRETFGAAALSVASSSFDTTLTQLGLRASAVVLPGPNLPVVDVHGLIGWQHAFGDTVPTVAASFASGSLPFTVSGAPIATDSLLLGFGLDTAIGQNARLGVAYTGQLASDVQDNAVKGTFSLRF